MSNFDEPSPGHAAPRVRWAHGAWALYLLSMVLPAFSQDNSTAFGLAAAYLSYIGALTYPFDNTISLLGMESEVLKTNEGIACILGAAANTCLIVAYFVFVVRWHFLKRVAPFRVNGFLGLLGALMAIASGIVLGAGDDSVVLSIGFFVWAASMLILCAACWRVRAT